MIVIGTDPHKRSHTAAAVDSATGELRSSETVAARFDGHLALLDWARSLDSERIWAIEDCRHVSGGLERSADYELIPPPTYPDAARSYRGLEGVHQWERLIDEIWLEWDFEAERFIDAGDEVAMFVRTSGTARQSGAAVKISAAHVLTVQDGRVTRTEVFLDRQEALEAVGLRE